VIHLLKKLPIDMNPKCTSQYVALTHHTHFNPVHTT